MQAVMSLRAATLVALASVPAFASPTTPFQAARGAETQERIVLFDPVPAPTRDGELRARTAGIDAAQLADLVARGVDGLVFPLFDDIALVGAVERVHRQPGGAVSLEGTLRGDPVGGFLVTFLGSSVAADLWARSGSYAIVPVRSGLHRIVELDPRYEPCAGALTTDSSPVRVLAPGPLTSEGNLPPWLADGVIDVAVYYTPAAVAYAGSVEAIECRIGQSVRYANLSFWRSEIAAELRLVYRAQVAYEEESLGLSDHLDRFANPVDGYMDEVHVDRDIHQFDLAALLVRAQNGGTKCGVARKPSSLSDENSELAYTCLEVSCGSHTYAHEHGHNLGMCHDRVKEGGDCNGITDYCYGHHLSHGGQTYRTIMAYPPGTPIPHWSNPEVDYPDPGDTPTGIAPPDSDSADAALTFEDTVPMVAGYRIGGEPDPGVTSLLSTSTAGGAASGSSGNVVVSQDERWVAFDSDAPDLVENDTNGASDVFVRDLASGSVVRVSHSSAGQESNGDSFGAAISADGRFVAFSSLASNLYQPDGNGTLDVFVHDRDFDADGVFDEPLQTRTVRVSITYQGAESNGPSGEADISSDGRFVAFSSLATNLVSGDGNGKQDVFVHDRDLDADGVFDESNARTTIAVSVSAAGVLGDDASKLPTISADGRHVGFQSRATNLFTEMITNDFWDVYKHDRDVAGDGVFDQPGDVSTTYVSGRYVAGFLIEQGYGNSTHPRIARDVPSKMVFQSLATNLFLSAASDAYVDIFQAQGAVIGPVTNKQDGDSLAPRITADGKYITFQSASSSLVPSDGNGAIDVFLACGSNVLGRISVGPYRAEGDGDSRSPDVSTSGRWVVFESDATNLVEGDTNGDSDAFVRDREASSVIPATLQSFSVQEGVHLEGNLASLDAYDDSRLRVDAAWRPTFPSWITEIDVSAAIDGFSSTEGPFPEFLGVQVWSRVSFNGWSPAVTQVISLENFTLGTFDVIDSVTLPLLDDVDVYRANYLVDPLDYVNPSTGEVTVRVEQGAIGLASEPGFVTGLDFVRVLGF